MAFLSALPLRPVSATPLRTAVNPQRPPVRPRSRTRMQVPPPGAPPPDADDPPPDPSSFGYTEPAYETPSTPDNNIPPKSDTASGANPVGEDPVEKDPVEASVRDVPSADLKRDLLSIASSTNRGLAATPAQREAVRALVSQLESSCPPDAPTDNPALLCGVWRLLFTDALDVLSLGLLAPVALVGPVYQNLSEATGDKDEKAAYDVENIVELEPVFAPVANKFFGRTMASVLTVAKAARKSPTRLDLKFVRFRLRQESVAGRELQGRLPALKLNLMSRVGWIDTTFLDEEIRVVRAPPSGKREGKNNIFVFVRDM